MPSKYIAPRRRYNPYLLTGNIILFTHLFKCFFNLSLAGLGTFPISSFPHRGKQLYQMLSLVRSSKTGNFLFSALASFTNSIRFLIRGSISMTSATNVSCFSSGLSLTSTTLPLGFILMPTPLYVLIMLFLQGQIYSFFYGFNKMDRHLCCFLVLYTIQFW